ncbi:hypothetical protein EST38_g2202 [Candolleomyces aberdarensis]|uniref:Uncharacterized protein n=1 Tax=Candolleomyces aberdarensis TaxID=2316362 RepID=A0A4V1Q4X8_9AGAR|nr:hypothetical protein EST38_g2202 [Candolleomyces aberdarensis]
MLEAVVGEVDVVSAAAATTQAAISSAAPPPPSFPVYLGPWAFFTSGYMLGLFVVAVLLHRIQNIIIPSRVPTRWRGARRRGANAGIWSRIATVGGGIWDTLLPLDLTKTTTRLAIHLPSLYLLYRVLLIWSVLILQTSGFYPEDAGFDWANRLGNWVETKDMSEVCWSTFVAVCVGFCIEGFVKALDGVEAGFPIGGNMNPNTSPFNIVGYAFLLHLYSSPFAHAYRKAGDLPSRPDKHAIITVAIPLLQLTLFHSLSVWKRFSTHRLLPTTLSSILSLTHFHGALFSYFYGSGSDTTTSFRQRGNGKGADQAQARLLTTYPILNYIPNLFETLLILTILLTLGLNVIVQLAVRGRVDRIFSGLGIRPSSSSSLISPPWLEQGDDFDDSQDQQEQQQDGAGGFWSFLQTLPYDEDFGVLLLRIGTASLEATGLRGWSNEVAPIPAPVPRSRRARNHRRGHGALRSAGDAGANGRQLPEYGSVRVGRVGAGGVQSGFRIPSAASSGGPFSLTGSQDYGDSNALRRRRTTPVPQRGLRNEVRTVDVGVEGDSAAAELDSNGNRRTTGESGWWRWLMELSRYSEAVWAASKGLVKLAVSWIIWAVKGRRKRSPLQRNSQRRGQRVERGSTPFERDLVHEEGEEAVRDWEQECYERFLRGESVTDDEGEDEEWQEEGYRDDASDTEDSRDDQENEEQEGEGDREQEAFGLFSDILRNGIAGSAAHDSSAGGDVVLAHLVDTSPMTRRRWRTVSSPDHNTSTSLRRTPGLFDEEFDDPFTDRSRTPGNRLDAAAQELAARNVCVICTSEARDIICWPCRRLVEGYSKIYIP